MPLDIIHSGTIIFRANSDRRRAVPASCNQDAADDEYDFRAFHWHRYEPRRGSRPTSKSVDSGQQQGSRKRSRVDDGTSSHLADAGDNRIAQVPVEAEALLELGPWASAVPSRAQSPSALGLSNSLDAGSIANGDAVPVGASSWQRPPLSVGAQSFGTGLTPQPSWMASNSLQSSLSPVAPRADPVLGQVSELEHQLNLDALFQPTTSVSTLGPGYDTGRNQATNSSFITDQTTGRWIDLDYGFALGMDVAGTSTGSGGGMANMLNDQGISLNLGEPSMGQAESGFDLSGFSSATANVTNYDGFSRLMEQAGYVSTDGMESLGWLFGTPNS
jgi:hypothetical protein